MDEEDERIAAWEAVASHPAIKPAYEGDGALLPRVIELLDHWAERDARTESVGEVQQAEEPRSEVWLRGFQDGFSRGFHEGQWWR